MYQGLDVTHDLPIPVYPRPTVLQSSILEPGLLVVSGVLVERFELRGGSVECEVNLRRNICTRLRQISVRERCVKYVLVCMFGRRVEPHFRIGGSVKDWEERCRLFYSYAFSKQERR